MACSVSLGHFFGLSLSLKSTYRTEAILEYSLERMKQQVMNASVTHRQVHGSPHYHIGHFIGRPKPLIVDSDHWYDP